MGTWGLKPQASERGGSLIEISFLMPWIFFLFVGILDFGFFGYALLSSENAARSAAMLTAQDTSSQSQTSACSAVKNEFAWMPNNSNWTGANSGFTCGATPLIVVQATLCGTSTPATITCGGTILKADGTTQAVANARPTTPACADCVTDPTSSSSRVDVSYQSIIMIPIPGVLMGNVQGKLGAFSFTRSSEQRILVQ